MLLLGTFDEERLTVNVNFGDMPSYKFSQSTDANCFPNISDYRNFDYNYRPT